MSTDAPIVYNPLAEGYVEDPFPHLAEMRHLDPVHHSPIGMWIAFRYDDVFALLRDPEMSVEEDNLIHRNEERIAQFESAMADLDPDASTFVQPSILDLDPPDHTRLRRLVSKAFTCWIEAEHNFRHKPV